jgi:hypothetical protein
MATERIPLSQPIESRNGTFTKDSYSSNCFFETRDQKREFIKRPGLVAAKQITPLTPPAYLDSQGLQAYNNRLIAVIANTVYSVNPTGYTVSTIGTTSASTSRSYFVNTFLENYMFFHNKLNLYLYSKTGVFGAVVTNKINAITITDSGANYSQGITLSFSAGGCAATAEVDPTTGVILSTTITNQGTGLSAAPTITINLPATQTPTGTDIGSSYVDFTVSSATGIYVGMSVIGTGIATGSKVTAIAGTQITVDTPKTGVVSGTITFADDGAGGVLTATLNFVPTGPYVSGAVFLNNYVLIGTSNNRIYNSDVGDPTTWNALNFLSFEQTADVLVGICKHLNYLVAFGAVSTQFFYDVGNPTGSPLGLAASYTSEIGCATGDSIVATNNTVLWIGTSKTYGRSVYLMDGTAPVRISTANIDRHIEADGLSDVSAYCYTINGHTLYILTLHNTHQTLVYDLNERMWYTWTQYSMQSNDQPNPGTYQESYFRPTYYTQLNGVPYVLDDDTATLYYLDVNTYQDAGQPIYCRTVTDISDNGSTKRKFFGRLEIIGDKVAGIMQIRHTGDDYNTWSSYRSVNLNAPRAQIYLSGADRRRAWEFLCTSNVPLRLDGAEVDFRIGEMDQEQAVGGGRYRR